MLLNDISLVRAGYKVVLLFSASESLNIFVGDELFKILECRRDNVSDIHNGKNLKEAEINGALRPLNGNYWLFNVNLDKTDKLLDDLVKNIESSKSGIYYIVTSKYFMYKKIKEKLQDVRIVDLYMGYLNSKDMVYIYDKKVRPEQRLSQELYTFLSEAYSSDIDAVFNLLDVLASGDKVETKKELVEICGVGGNSIPRFTIGLLESKMSSKTGSKRVVRNKTKQVLSFAEAYDWRYIQAVILNTVEALCDLKMLYINGSLYKKNLERQEAEGFDDKRIARGMKFWYKIHELPLNELINLRVQLEIKPWYSDMDFMSFLYEYYGNEI